MNLKSKEFKSLQNTWYKKLKESGFNEIEQDEDRLKNWTSSRILKGKNIGNAWADIQVSREAREEYYRLAGQFLYEYKFKSALEKKIWTLHSTGMSFREIAKELRSTKFKCTKDTINRAIKPLAEEMLKIARSEYNE